MWHTHMLGVQILELDSSSAHKTLEVQEDSSTERLGSTQDLRCQGPVCDCGLVGCEVSSDGGAFQVSALSTYAVGPELDTAVGVLLWLWLLCF